MVSRAIVEHNQRGRGPSIVEDLIHTGQHYDDNMSDIFFRQMGIPAPAVNLNIGGGSHGEMTGKMLAQIEQEILNRKPDWTWSMATPTPRLPVRWQLPNSMCRSLTLRPACVHSINACRRRSIES